MKKTDWISYKDASGASKRCKWPSEIKRLETPGRITVSLASRSDAAVKLLDPWAMASHGAYLSKTKDANPDVMVEITHKVDPCQIEALKRRLSFLNHINSFQVTLKVKGKVIKLYTFGELMALPDNGEFIDEDLISTEDALPDENKALQEHLFDPTGVMGSLKAYLRGASMGRCPAHCCKGEVLRAISEFEKEDLAKGRTNKFAVLGEDFGGKKRFVALRNACTGAFRGSVDEDTRSLPAELIDVVTINRHRQLALVEIAVDKPSLEVLSKALNHSLFFQVFWPQIMGSPAVVKAFSKQVKGDHFVCYMASNTFHPLFDLAAHYYSPSSTYQFELKKVLLGSTTSI